jgi:hypothetical protein
MENLLPLLIQLIGGGAGGNIAGSLLKNLDLSRLMQTILGVIGGVASGQAVDMMGVLEQVLGAGGAGGLLGNVGVSGVGGAILTILIGLLKKSLAGGAK